MIPSSQQQVLQRGSRRSSRLCDHARVEYGTRSRPPPDVWRRLGVGVMCRAARASKRAGADRSMGREETRWKADGGGVASDSSTARFPGAGGPAGGTNVGRELQEDSIVLSVEHSAARMFDLFEETATAEKGRATAGGKIRGSFKARQSSEGAFSSIYLLALVDISADAGRAVRQPRGGTLPVQVKAVAPGAPRSVNVATLLLRSRGRDVGRSMWPIIVGSGGLRRAEQGRRRTIGATARRNSAPTRGKTGAVSPSSR